jgi:hypothetical protein
VGGQDRYAKSYTPPLSRLDDNLLHIVNHAPFLDRGETMGAPGHGRTWF